ncbi:MAG: hypothetical protein FWC72_02715 [Oscillospiraceae bacterium]|nr:hypothetical protein [Oscillospiraceae bacterium]
MSTYKEMYLTLARAQRDVILTLQEAHQKAEEMHLVVDVPDHLRVIRPEPLQTGEQSHIRCLNLSLRVYNALNNRLGRRGCDDIPTVKDVLNIESYKELKKIRNLGEKSCLELIRKMQEAGFTDWAEQIARGLTGENEP